jgi:hypothetical protein
MASPFANAISEPIPSSGANWASIFFSSPISFHGVYGNSWNLNEASVYPIDGPCVPPANVFGVVREWQTHLK